VLLSTIGRFCWLTFFFLYFSVSGDFSSRRKKAAAIGRVLTSAFGNEIDGPRKNYD
jgi:hypothetical protein